MKATVHFSRIKDEIITNLKKANESIKIAVAWFTDEDIIRVLSQMKEANIDIQLAISNSKENFQNIYNFKDYIRLQAKLFVSSNPFLHHKFCIIDNNIIITGSYNWSYAARRNEENIVVMVLEEGRKEDDELLKRFDAKHKFLCDKCSSIIHDIETLKSYRLNYSKDLAVIQSKLDEEEIQLRQEFENDIKLNVQKSKGLGIPLSPNLLERMVKDGGGVEFIKRLLRDEIASGDLKSGFKKLEEQIPHRVDLSFEYLVSRPKYEKLFNNAEIAFSKNLMAKYCL